MHGKGALTGGTTDIAYQLLTKGKVDLKEVTFSTVTGAIVTPGVAKVTTFAIDNWGTVGKIQLKKDGSFNIKKVMNMNEEELKNAIPEIWEYTKNKEFIHIKDNHGKYRIRIDPPDSTVNYKHMHLFDANKHSLDSKGNIVKKTDIAAHIPYKY